MRRAEILVDGEIQGVGYRYFVRRIARKHKLAGSVENLKDGRVKIVCEGEESSIKAFLKDIAVKEPPIIVESVKHEFSSATGKFRGFKIITGKLEEEMIEGFSTGMTYLQGVREDVRKVGEDVRKVGEDVRKVGEDVKSVGEEVKGVREEVRGVREDVRKVGEDVKSVGEEVKGVREEVVLTRETLSSEIKGVREEVAFTREELKDEVRGLRSDLKSYLDERFARLEKEIERIKEKIGIL